MPPPPEIGGILRLVGRVEVNRQAETHQQRQADGNIGITRKVTVNLKGISEKGHNVGKTRKHGRSIKHLVHEMHGQVIGKNHFFEQPFQDHKGS